MGKELNGIDHLSFAQQKCESKLNYSIPRLTVLFSRLDNTTSNSQKNMSD